MINSLIVSLQEWNKNTSERAKLQHVYILLIIIITLLAGLVSLVNVNLGQVMLQFSFGSLFVFVINAVIWALIKSFVIDRLPNRRTTKK
jgi:hypothetical protein